MDGCRWLRWRVSDEPTLRGIACLRLRLHEAFAHCCQRGFRHFPLRLQDAVSAAAFLFAEEGAADQDAGTERRVRGRCVATPVLRSDIPCSCDHTCFCDGFLGIARSC